MIDGATGIAGHITLVRLFLPPFLLSILNLTFWAAAPKGSMTYDSTQGNFLRVSESPGLRVSGSPSPPSIDPFGTISDPPGPTTDPQILRLTGPEGVDDL